MTEKMNGTVLNLIFGPTFIESVITFNDPIIDSFYEQIKVRWSLRLIPTGF